MRYLIVLSLCVLPWLAGCAVLDMSESDATRAPIESDSGWDLGLWPGGCEFGSDCTVPPAPQVMGMAAQNLVVQRKVRAGHGGQPDVFLPLLEAKSAVEAAQSQPDVDGHAAQMLAQARVELEKAEQAWPADPDEDGYDPSRLIRVATHAHKARRLAQIARFTAQREINLAQLDRASTQLRQMRLASRNASAQRTATVSGGQRLIGQKVVPDRFGAFSFAPGTARLTAQSGPVLAKLAALLEQNPQVGIAILAHTSNDAPPDQALEAFVRANPQLGERDLSHRQKVYAYHMALSNARARAVALALVQAGVPARRIGARGFGSSRPVASNDTANGRAANERVIAVIIPGPDTEGSPLQGRGDG